MRKRTIISLLAAIAALAAVVSVSGCGGSANGSSGGKVALVAGKPGRAPSTVRCSSNLVERCGFSDQVDAIVFAPRSAH